MTVTDLAVPPAELTIASAVATVTFGRGGLNPLGSQVLAALADRVEEAGQASRAVVLTGRDCAFTCGGDLREVSSGENPAETIGALAGMLNSAIRAIRNCPVPVVAAAEGVAAGAGLSLLAACDLAVLARSLRIVPAYLNAGLSPDGGLTATLPALVGRHRAAEMLLLGTGLTSEQAVAAGFGNRIADDGGVQSAAQAMAAELARAAPGAVARTLRLLRQQPPRELLDGVLEQERADIAASAAEPAASAVLARFAYPADSR